MKNTARILLLLGGDIAMLVAAFFAMLALAFPGELYAEITKTHLLPFSIVGILWILIFFIFNLYNTRLIKPTAPHLQQIGIASLVAIAISFIFFYLIPSFGITPKTNLLIFSGTFISLFIGWRRIYYSIFASNFKIGVAIITGEDGKNSYVEELINYINTYPQSGFFVTGAYNSLKDFLKEQADPRIDTLIVSQSVLGDPEGLKALYNTGKNILDISYAYEDIFGKIPVSSIDEAWFLHNIQGIGKGFYERISRIISIVVSLIALIIISPILIVAAVLVKFYDNGPVLYTQLRVGKNGRNFKLYKLRSMIVDADKNGAQWTDKNDKRITAIGKIIRKLHIDEAPQLWNIIKGDMALVGPRPELPTFVEKLEKEIPHYSIRHIITPGFTGWAQIKFRQARGVEDTKEKFEYDLYYIKNRNLFVDIGILLRTVMIIFTHK